MAYGEFAHVHCQTRIAKKTTPAQKAHQTKKSKIWTRCLREIGQKHNHESAKTNRERNKKQKQKQKIETTKKELVGKKEKTEAKTEMTKKRLAAEGQNRGKNRNENIRLASKRTKQMQKYDKKRISGEKNKNRAEIGKQYILHTKHQSQIWTRCLREIEQNSPEKQKAAKNRKCFWATKRIRPEK